MRRQFSPMSIALAALALTVLAGCTPVSLAPMTPPAPKSQSVADADRKLAQVAGERTQAEAAFAASEQLCYKKFLVNRCLDSAREKRRSTLVALRAIELEAEHFKRKAAVEQRDRDIAEAERKFQAEDARMAAEERAPRAEPAEPAPKTGAPAASRAAEHASKEKQRAQQDKAGAATRAANVQAYEKRKRESEQRQREIEEKKQAKAKEAEGK